MEAKTRFAFAKKRIESLPTPTSDRAVYHDTACPGLTLRVTAAGVKTFTFYKKFKGTPIRLKIGDFPAMSVENARTAAKGHAHLVANGIDPRTARDAAKDEPTLGKLWLYWIEWAKGHKRSWTGDSWIWNARLKPWTNRKLSAIRQSDVAALHAKIGREHGPYSANRMLSLLGAMFNASHNIGWKCDDNPTEHVQRFKEEPRERFLTADELPRFFAALNAESNEDMRDFFTLALLTGARRSNVQALEWNALDLDRGLWMISAADAKGGKALVLPLVEPAVKLLRERKSEANGDRYVFPSSGKTGHIVEPKSAWKRILKRAGLEGIRVHDLRRTLGSWQALGGASLPIIGRSLGHTQMRSTAVYSRLTVDPVRESVTKATAAIFAHDKGAPAAGNAAIDGGSMVIDVPSTPADPA